MISPHFKNLHFALFGAVFLLFNLSVFAQVGVGTTEPEAMLHVKGDYVAPITSISTLLNENFQTIPLGTYVKQINNRIGTCPTDGWKIANDPADKCTPCSSRMLYLNSNANGCTQNTTAIVPFGSNPTSGAVTISFDYRFLKYNPDSDFMDVYLYNENTNVADQILHISNNDIDSSYSGTWPVIPGNNYSLRFQYVGTWGKSATVDNVSVTEQAITTPGKYAFKLEDGTQGSGYVLTSDSQGNAKWQPYSKTLPLLEPVDSSEKRQGLQQTTEALRDIIDKRQAALKIENEKVKVLETKIRKLE